MPEMNSTFRSLLAGMSMVAASASISSASPVVPGFAYDGEQFTLADKGELLLSELNCLSCHSASKEVMARVGTKSAPDLSKVGERLTPHYIEEFIRNPHSTKEGTTMPGIFHSSEAQAADGAVEFLTHFLVSQSGGIKPSKAAINSSLVQRGRDIFHKVGCVACHAPEKEGDGFKGSVPIGNQSRKTTVEQLTAFLKNPHSVRGSGRMPNLGLSDAEAEAVAFYLLKEQVENPPTGKKVEVAGFAVEYFEGSWNRLPNFSKLKPKATGISERITHAPAGIKVPGDGYGLRFTGILKVGKKGTHKFWLKSDDGSRFLIDGKVVINNDGIHAANEVRKDLMLEKGDHEIVVEYFEKSGQQDLGLRVIGPGLPRGEITKKSVRVKDQTPMSPVGMTDFKVDKQKALMGGRMFAVMRCVSCHKMGDLKPMTPSKPLASLNVASGDGCLSSAIRKGLPDYKLSDEQRSALKAALGRRDELNKPLPPKASVRRTMAKLNCYACHKRDGIGGPSEARKEFFQTNFEIDLGDEGNLPPHLNGSGSKLKKSALERILWKKELHVRPFMATRMPQFGKGNVESIVDALIASDKQEGDLKNPEFSEESVEVGHKFVGVTGLSCVACHNVNGNKAVGVPGIDLVTVHERINPGWFHRFLVNPATMNPGTRMPAFWPEGRSFFPDILEGDSQKQFSAIWNYLSLGVSMKRPEGVQPPGGVGLELFPDPEPIVHRTFMEGVGPRSILAGFPENVHAAFDANNVRLAKVWRGRFFDASGVASGRTDTFKGPLGKDSHDLPAGPAIAKLESGNAPWPKAEKTDRNTGGRFRGYRLDAKGRPTFHYELEGVEVSESPVPEIREGGACISRKFTLNGKAQSDVYLLAARGSKITKQGDRWALSDGSWVTVSGSGADEPFVRQIGKQAELVVPVKLTGKAAEIEVLVQW